MAGGQCARLLEWVRYRNRITASLADMIESRVETADIEVKQGVTELEQARRSQAKYRKKVLVLLVIAVIIGLIVTGIIVSSLKS